MFELTLPTVHLNGTGKQTLLAEYENAFDKLREFCSAFQAATFHPRDYYVQGPDAYNQAREQRLEVMQSLEKLYDYVETHVFHLHEQ